MKEQNKNLTVKKAFTSDLTTFKLSVYYSHRNTGQAYTKAEIDRKENRKFHNSIDFLPTVYGYYTRHDIALSKLTNHISKNRAFIISALLFVNDFKEKKQFLIGKYSKNADFDMFTQPLFTYKELKKDVLYNGLAAKPIDIFELKHFKLA